MTGPSAPKPCAMAKNTAIAFARTSSGKISLTVRYAALAPAEAEKKITHQEIVWVIAVSNPALNNQALTANIIPEPMYVPAIILLRPMVSKKWPMVRGPAKLPTAKAMRYSDVDVAGTP